MFEPVKRDGKSQTTTEQIADSAQDANRFNVALRIDPLTF